MWSSDKKSIGERILFKTRNRWATRASERMVQRGILWKESGQSVDYYTIQNYHQLRTRLGSLTGDEELFLGVFKNAPFYAVHCTDSRSVLNKKEELIIYSRKKLIEKNIFFNADNTQPIDLSLLSNDDYVFFSLEVGKQLKKNSSRFGSIFFKIPYSHPVFRNSSMVLTDQVTLCKSTCRIPGLSQKACELLSAREFDGLKIFFNGKMMSLLGLAYSIIVDNRSLPVADQKIVLSARTPTELSNVVNSFFRPEIRVPHMVGIHSGDFCKHMEHVTEQEDYLYDSDCELDIGESESDSEGWG